MLRHKNKFTKALSLMLALIFIVSAFAGCGGDKNTDESTTEAPKNDIVENNEPIENVIRNPLTGEAGYDEALLNNKPVFVVVENTAAARPQWGLTSSDMVFEMVAEGGIARMLLVYSDISRLPDKIGPVRSARNYFVNVVEGFGGAFIHFGGPPNAYSAMDSNNTPHMDGLTSESGYFSRDTSRNVSREHTAYTSKEWATKYFENKNLDLTIEEEYKEPFKFNTENVKFSGGECTEITFSLSSGYKYTYTLNEDDNRYYSKLNGEAFVDSEGTQQSFDNVIICYTNIYPLDDGTNDKRVVIELNQGNGVYVSNGTYEDITWEKGDATDSFKFYGADGKELKLNIGKTYVGITDSDNASSTVIA